MQDCYKPHPLVEATLNGMLIVLKLPATLLEAQTTLQAPDFKSWLLDFDVSTLDDATLHRLKRSLNRPLLTVEVGSLLTWLPCTVSWAYKLAAGNWHACAVSCEQCVSRSQAWRWRQLMEALCTCAQPLTRPGSALTCRD